MKNILKNEMLVQMKINNVIQYALMFFSFCLLSITLVSNYEAIGKFGIIFSVICIPLAFINLSNMLIKPDIEDGYLELKLITSSAFKIVMAKLLALAICILISFSLMMPIIYIIFNVLTQTTKAIYLCGIILITLSASLVTLIASIQGYFRSNTNFLALLIMPLIIPTIILSGMVLQAPENLYLIKIMIGINFVIIPPSILLSAYLVKNIYNPN